MDVVKQNIKDSKSITIVTGYLTTAGWNLIDRDISAAIKRNCQVRIFSDSRELNTDYSLLYRLNKRFNKRNKNFYGMVFDDSNISMLHAKFFVFDKNENYSVIIVGSSNLTYPALMSNLEAGVMLALNARGKFYRNISAVIDSIESSSYEPSEEDYRSYMRKKGEIERARAHLLRKARAQRLVLRTNRDIISDIKKFGSMIKRDFNDPNLLNAIRHSLKKVGSTEPDKCRDAVLAFTKLVLQKRKVFSGTDAFKLMLQIYANILHYSHHKPRLERLLRHDLKSYVKVQDIWIEKVLSDSIPGKYDGVVRGVRKPFRFKQVHINETLNLLDSFYRHKDYDVLLDSFITFYRRTSRMQPRGAGLITAITSTLQTRLFIVCNRRTRRLRRISKQYSRVLGSKSLANYPKFNEVFRYLGQRTGTDNLRKLDLAASNIYEEMEKEL